MSRGLLRRQLLRPQAALTFEERLQRAFPGSEWISTQSGPTEGQQKNPNSDPGGTFIAVIGGAKFDEASLLTWLRTLPRDVILVTTAPRLKQDGEPYKGDFGGELQRLCAELLIRVDFVARKEDQYGTYADSVQLRDIIRATGAVVLVGSGQRPRQIKALAEGDWAMAKAVLGDREVLEVA